MANFTFHYLLKQHNLSNAVVIDENSGGKGRKKSQKSIVLGGNYDTKKFITRTKQEQSLLTNRWLVK